eukprot:2199534-Pyramimonas_sp.AAC.2
MRKTNLLTHSSTFVNKGEAAPKLPLGAGGARAVLGGGGGGGAAARAGGERDRLRHDARESDRGAARPHPVRVGPGGGAGAPRATALRRGAAVYCQDSALIPMSAPFAGRGARAGEGDPGADGPLDPL